MDNEIKNFSNDVDFEPAKENLSSRFERERLEWRTKVEAMSEGIRDIYNCADMLVDTLSNRQIALEYSHLLMSLVSKINADLREKRRERWLHYTQNVDLKLDKDPKQLFIDTDLKKIILAQELLQNHLTYIRSTIDTIDKLIWGIKWRISLQDYQRSQH